MRNCTVWTSRVRFVNNFGVQFAFVANSLDDFQVPSSVPVSKSKLANCLEAFFIDVLTRWVFVIQTLTIHLAFIEVDKLKKARDPDHTNDLSARAH